MLRVDSLKRRKITPVEMRILEIGGDPYVSRCAPAHGEHCLYYQPEPGGLSEAVERTLQDRETLRGIAEQGHAFIL
jgi:hypothetical protein